MGYLKKLCAGATLQQQHIVIVAQSAHFFDQRKRFIHNGLELWASMGYFKNAQVHAGEIPDGISSLLQYLRCENGRACRKIVDVHWLVLVFLFVAQFYFNSRMKPKANQ
jgi:hypothetical protein